MFSLRMFKANLFVIVMLSFPVSMFGNTLGDCLWGGRNEETLYKTPFVPGMGRTELSQLPSSQMNLGAPPPGIPIQATANTQGTVVSQTTLPTATAPINQVGTVGLPATSPNAINLPQAPPGTEIMFVLPTKMPEKDECCDGVRSTPAVAAEIVPPGTPGAIPVAVQTMTVTRPKITHRFTYSPIRTQTDKLVEVVDPRTGQVVKTYCETDEQHSMLPWPHMEEVVTYETITAKVATPIRLPDVPITQTNPAAAAQTINSTNIVPTTNPPATFAPVNNPTRQTVNYPLWNPNTNLPIPPQTGSHTTVIVP